MLGTATTQTELLDADGLCGHLVPEDSIHRKLTEVGEALFGDADFADLYDTARGRHSVPPSLLAKVLLLRSLEGTSDRETVDRVRRDIGWKVACDARAVLAVLEGEDLPEEAGKVEFRFSAEVCAACSLRSQCTSSRHGRRVTVGRHEALLAEARARQRTQEFKDVYNGKRPTVERVISRLVRRGGRKARFRCRDKVAAQVALKAAGENLLRMLRLGLSWTTEAGWATV